MISSKRRGTQDGKAVEINKVCRDGKRFILSGTAIGVRIPLVCKRRTTTPDRMNRKLECILYLFPLPKGGREFGSIKGGRDEKINDKKNHKKIFMGGRYDLAGRMWRVYPIVPSHPF